MIWLLVLIGIVWWIIEDHKAVMVELEAMRERAKASEGCSFNDIMVSGD